MGIIWPPTPRPDFGMELGLSLKHSYVPNGCKVGGNKTLTDENTLYIYRSRNRIKIMITSTEDCHLTTEPIESPSLPLQCVHNVHSSDGLALGMLGVGHGVPDNILKENLQTVE